MERAIFLSGWVPRPLLLQLTMHPMPQPCVATVATPSSCQRLHRSKDDTLLAMLIDLGVLDLFFFM